jgi:drug/metabolite transporter (DMT)-like permease
MTSPTLVPPPAPGPAPGASRLGDTLLLVAPGVIWGASFLFIAEGLEILGPDGVTFARILIGFLTLALFPAARRPLPRAGWAGAALLGVIWMAFPLSLFPHAEQRVSSALAGMLNGAVPLVAAVVAALLARRLPSRGIVAGLAVGLAGVVMVAWPSLGAGGSSLAGVVMVLAAVVSYGFAVNLARPLQVAHGALPVLLRAQAVALVLTAPLGLPELLEIRWRWGPVLSVLALGALGTGLAFVLMTVAAGRLGATRASATTFLMPPVALLLGVAVRGEQVALLSVLGGAVCVAGAGWIRRAQEHAAAAPKLVAVPAEERAA